MLRRNKWNHIKCSIKRRVILKKCNKQYAFANMINIKPTISTITFNVDGINTQIKKQTVKIDKKEDPIICCLRTLLTRNHFRYKDTDRLKVKEQRKINHANTSQKKAGEPISISADKADGRTRKIIRDKGGHYTRKKESILCEDITILNVYVHNERASKYMREN